MRWPLSDEEDAEAEDVSAPGDAAGDVAEDAAEQIARLTSTLHEKDDLVAALTSRLEEAAEQLDRLRRTGSRGGGGGSDLVDQQRRLTEQLHAALESWEAMQPASHFEHISGQLEDLRQLIAGRPAMDSHGAAASDGSHLAPAAGEAGDHWSTLKARLLNEASGEVPANVPADEAEPAAVDLLDELPPPEPIDFDTAERQHLEEAVIHRDTYIAQLIRRLRSSEFARQEKIDWTALNNAPEELRAHLVELERRLQHQLSRGELEMSLERARLAREHAQWQQAQRRAEVQLRQTTLGVVPPPQEPEEKAAENSRWNRLFGR